jgi:peptide/nickel transport system substrate-binding protein
MEKKAARWWDKLGKPQYGGELVFRLNRKIVNFDPYFGHHLTQIHTGWMERLHAADWTQDLSEVSHDKIDVLATRGKGHLAESWEFTDPYTYVVHLHKGIHWQDIPPANGREFTADDVAFHFHRLYGLGSGYTQPSPARAAVEAMKELVSVTATDKYTVVFKWKTSNQSLIIESMEEIGTYQCIENPEAVRKWGDLRDWHHAIGTGPFILKEFVPDVSATLVKNPNYWGHDERYPQNKLPYIDRMKLLIIPDQEITLAEMRAGRIDAADQISPVLAQELKRTNPEILQIYLTANTAVTIDPRNDRPPFNDIRVRKAMQLAIDLPGIAKNYYKGSVEPYPSSLTSREMKGWGFPYEEWPQDLKDEYAYKPALARKLLADAGYPHGFKTNIVADTTGDLDLLQIVKGYFADIGIDMEIRPMDSTEWIAFVLNGHQHDQLAQRTIAPYGHRHDPVRQMGRLRTGAASNYLMINDAILDSFQPKAIAAASEDQVKQLLRDANEYIARQHFAISLLSPGSYTLYQPWLKGFHGQFGAFCSAAGSPQLLFFYPARFWIDKDLKKKMGH